MEKLGQRMLRVAFLHMAPRDDNVAYNVHLLEDLYRQAAATKPDLILTPELAVSGYEFHSTLGIGWIQSETPAIHASFCRLAEEYHIALVLGSPLYEPQSGRYHNSALFIDESGQIIGIHHKILVLPGNLEGWASPGIDANPVLWRGYRLGLMICSDAYSQRLVSQLAQRDAQALISLAAWAPGELSPSGEWETRSQETGLPVLVCNRTGQGAKINFEGSCSVAVIGGQRVAEYSGIPPAILTMDFDANWQPISKHFSIYSIKSEL